MIDMHTRAVEERLAELEDVLRLVQKERKAKQEERRIGVRSPHAAALEREVDRKLRQLL